MTNDGALPATPCEPRALAIPLQAATDVSTSGQKAVNLGRLLRHGLRVPEGFVIPNAAFTMFLSLARAADWLDAILSETRMDDPKSFEEAAGRIAHRLQDVDLPDPVADAVQAELRSWPEDRRAAVRSSAVGEDGQHASFAGQLDSFLDLDGVDSILEALRRCWISYWSGRTQFYQQSRGCALRGMGVLVQQYIPAVCSGVVFTSAGAAARSRSIVVELVPGACDGLVSGRLTPDRIEIDGASGCWTHHKAPESQWKGAWNGRELSRLVPQLIGIAQEVSAVFDGPQDIEWCLDEHQCLYVLQARPVTAPMFSREAGCATSGAVLGAGSDRSCVWTNANVNENFPQPLSPLLYSIARDGYYHYFRNLGLAIGIPRRRVDAMEPQLRQIIGVHGGRMYYNLTNIHAALQAAPGGKLLSQAFDRFVGAESEAAGADVDVPRSNRRFGQRARALPALLNLALRAAWQFASVRRQLAAFEATVDDFAGRTRPETFDDLTLAELAELFREFHHIRCHQWLGGSLADASTVICYGALYKLLEASIPRDEVNSIQNALLQGLDEVVSSRQVEELWKLAELVRSQAALRALFQGSASDIQTALQSDSRYAEFHDAFGKYLQDWGFRCSGELLLTVPSFQEQPELLLEILRTCAAAEGSSPFELLQKQRANRLRMTLEVHQRLRRQRWSRWSPWPRRSWLFRRLLRQTQGSIALRERARLKQSLLYSRCRRIALAIGHRLTDQRVLEAPVQIFSLTHQEIDDLLTGSALYPYSVREMVEQRREAHEQLADMQCPDHFTLPSGDYWPLTTDTTRAEPRSAQTDGSTKDVLTGTCASPGNASGRVAVLESVHELHRLQSGDILVARQTDPGWAPVFCLIRGLILERGGMLSHGAILAREYGIPTVVGVNDATERIPHGAHVSLHADVGEVLLDPQSVPKPTGTGAESGVAQ